MARPTKLTPQLVEKLVPIIADGVAIEVACTFVGIDDATLYRWSERGRAELARVNERPGLTAAERAAEGWPAEAGEAPYREFVEALMAARATAEKNYTQALTKAIQGGAVKRETTRTYTDPETGAEVVERVVEYTEPDWRAAGYWLDRRTGPRFARKQTVELTGADGGSLQIDATVSGGSMDEDRVFMGRILYRLDEFRRERQGGLIIDGETVDETPAALPAGDDAGRV